MRRTRPYWKRSAAAMAACVAWQAGCREEIGPVVFPTTRVHGVIREGGRPVRGGWIEFMPIDGTVGNLRSAPISGDGTFEATNVAVGTNAIGLVDAPIGLPEGQRRFRPQNSPIRREIPAGGASPLVIDLLEEAFRHQKETPREVPEATR